MIANQPALDATCKLMCTWGGAIQFTAPAQFTVEL
jgi:hypothetical protein